MFELRRLRLLHELHRRGTIAAVADALQLTPSAVSQQLAVLARETGLALLEPAGRGVRLTDPALVLVGHATALLDRAELAEAELAAVAGSVVGRARIASFQSAARHIAAPVMKALEAEAPRLRCELVEAEPEKSLPALSLGDFDLVLADEWEHQPHQRPDGVDRHHLRDDPVYVVLPADHPIAIRYPVAVPLGTLAGEPWATSHRGLGWEEVTERTCRQLGGFDPDVHHRTNDSVVTLELVANGLAVTLLPELALDRHPGVAVREIADGPVQRTIYAATRTADAERPSVGALLAQVFAVTAALRPEARRPAPRASRSRTPR